MCCPIRSVGAHVPGWEQLRLAEAVGGTVRSTKRNTTLLARMRRQGRAGRMRLGHALAQQGADPGCVSPERTGLAARPILIGAPRWYAGANGRPARSAYSLRGDRRSRAVQYAAGTTLDGASRWPGLGLGERCSGHCSAAPARRPSCFKLAAPRCVAAPKASRPRRGRTGRSARGQAGPLPSIRRESRWAAA